MSGAEVCVKVRILHNIPFSAQEAECIESEGKLTETYTNYLNILIITYVIITYDVLHFKVQDNKYYECLNTTVFALY